jgi:hypothetical protein
MWKIVTWVCGLGFILLILLQVSLIEAPEHRKKRLMTLTTNVMRDDSDKVKNMLFDLFI